MPPKSDDPKPKKTAPLKKAISTGNEAEVMDAEIDEGLAESGFYKAIRNRTHPYQEATVTELLSKIGEQRVKALADSVATYIIANLPKAISKRKGLAGYRTSPYVLLTSANVMRLTRSSGIRKIPVRQQALRWTRNVVWEVHRSGVRRTLPDW